eukprot:11637158-Karenia_brevis.AAC.1
MLPGFQALQLLEKHFKMEESALRTRSAVRLELTTRNKRGITVLSKNFVFLYAMRPLTSEAAPELSFLSLYEFLRYWRVEPPVYALTEDEACQDWKSQYQAKLTEAGVKKVTQSANGTEVKFFPLEDYIVKEEGATWWLPFPDHPSLKNVRHAWILVRNDRPCNPSFHHAPMPKKQDTHEERNAMLLMAYFHPYTLLEDPKVAHVPHVRDLKKVSGDWSQALRQWLDGQVLTQEARRYIHNFLVVSQMRPVQTAEADNHSEDIFSDEDLDVSSHDIEELLRTCVGASHEKHVEEDYTEDLAANEDESQSSKMAMSRADQVWQRTQSRLLDTSEPGNVADGSSTVDENKLKAWKRAATKSQRND